MGVFSGLILPLLHPGSSVELCIFKIILKFIDFFFERETDINFFVPLIYAFIG